MKQLTEETLKRVDLLAEKLGIATEHLWSILVRQAKYEFIMSLFWLVLCTAGAIFLYKKRVDIENWCKGSYGDKQIIVFIGLIGYFIVLLVNVYNFSSCFSYLLNPEYFALTEIFNLL